MMLKKFRGALIAGTVVFVNASISLGSPGTAADMIFRGPSADRISERSNG